MPTSGLINKIELTSQAAARIENQPQIQTVARALFGTAQIEDNHMPARTVGRLEAIPAPPACIVSMVANGQKTAA